LISKFEIQAVGCESSAGVLEWVKRTVSAPPYHITITGQGTKVWESAFADGKVLAALVDSRRPGTPPHPPLTLIAACQHSSSRRRPHAHARLRGALALSLQAAFCRVTTCSTVA
jgi:hypothetical protein